jgi:glycosyltransferase involved in cell wall biosynthesis
LSEKRQTLEKARPEGDPVAPETGRVSVLILTFNESRCIERCIESVCGWSDDIVILDSCSSDDTLDIAGQFEFVRTYQNEFKGYASQRNYGLHKIEYRHGWVMLLDADEVMTGSLKSEIDEVLSTLPAGITSMTFKRRDYFGQRWMPPFWNVRFERLVRPKKVSYTGEVHEKLSSTDNQYALRGHVDHFPFSKGLEDWLMRRVKRSRVCAEEELEGRLPLRLHGIISRNQVDRQRSLKAIFQRMPFRCPAYFLYLYIFRGGFTAGLDGLEFCFLETFSKFLVCFQKHDMERGRND